MNIHYNGWPSLRFVVNVPRYNVSLFNRRTADIPRPSVIVLYLLAFSAVVERDRKQKSLLVDATSGSFIPMTTRQVTPVCYCIL
jgi:hypothetical protein